MKSIWHTPDEFVPLYGDYGQVTGRYLVTKDAHNVHDICLAHAVCPRSGVGQRIISFAYLSDLLALEQKFETSVKALQRIANNNEIATSILCFELEIIADTALKEIGE